jgi:hypothetical protein
MLLNSINSNPAPSLAPLIGSLLVSSQILDSKPLNQALNLAEKSKQPIGRTLIELGHLKERDLRSGLLAQSLIAKGFVSQDIAIKALRLSYRKLITLDAAFDEIQSQSEQSTCLGNLLLKAGIISEAEYEEAISVSKDTGMMLGRFLLIQGSISELELKTALDTQRNLRNGNISEEMGAEILINLHLKQTIVDQSLPMKKSFYNMDKFIEYLVCLSSLLALSIAIYLSLNSLLFTIFFSILFVFLATTLIVVLKLEQAKNLAT